MILDIMIFRKCQHLKIDNVVTDGIVNVGEPLCACAPKCFGTQVWAPKSGGYRGPPLRIYNIEREKVMPSFDENESKPISAERIANEPIRSDDETKIRPGL